MSQGKNGLPAPIRCVDFPYFREELFFWALSCFSYSKNLRFVRADGVVLYRKIIVKYSLAFTIFDDYKSASSTIGISFAIEIEAAFLNVFIPLEFFFNLLSLFHREVFNSLVYAFGSNESVICNKVEGRDRGING